MKMSEMMPKEIYDLLESALDEKIENFEVKKHEGNEKGQGYLGDMLFISLKNKKTGEDHHFVIKQVLNSTTIQTMDFMANNFKNETHFYMNVIPSLTEFQKSYPGVEIFDKVPKCLAATSEKGKEKILLENLKVKNFELHPKKEPLSDKMYEAIFKLYGQYHGLSYAFKNHQSEKFFELGSGFQNNFKNFIDCGLLSKGVERVCQMVKAMLEKKGEVKIAEKFVKYTDNGVKLFLEAITHKSPYSVIIHGDCWSNNMMFKFNKSEDIEDIKMLDFQMAMIGSPVLDLTYSFYSGAAKETLDNLEHFLKIYYKSLNATLKQYGCDVEEILPYEALKNEWKKYNAFGFLMGLLLLMNKNSETTEVPNISEIMDKKTEGEIENPIAMNMDSEGFQKAALSLLRHMYENDFL